MEERALVKSLEQALRNVFGEGEEAQKFINVSRIPLICNAIVKIDERLGNMETQLDSYRPVKMLVYGAVGAILTAIIGVVISRLF